MAQSPHPVQGLPFLYSAGKKLFSFICLDIKIDCFGHASIQNPQLLHAADSIRIIPFKNISLNYFNLI